MVKVLVLYYSSYGHVSCITGGGTELRMPTTLELQMCRYQGEHVTRIASRLAAETPT